MMQKNQRTGLLQKVVKQNLEDTSGCFYGEARRSSQAMDEKEAL